jgi:hypothetical protein
LSTDGNALVDLAHKLGGFFTRGEIAANLHWEEERMSGALTALAKDGLLLIDDPPSTAATTAGGGGRGGGARVAGKKSVEVLEREKAVLAANRIYWCPAVGMEAAVEEFQRREKLPVVGFNGLGTIANRSESAMLSSD